MIANYRAERKKGLPQVKCKKAIAAARPLLKEIARHQKELEDIAAICAKAQKIAAKWEADYRDKKAYAEALARNFKFLSQVVLMTAPQAEMVTYFVHCMELKKLFAEAETCAKKLGKRAKADQKEALDRAAMAKDQHQYTSRGVYWEDLEGRIY